MIHAILVPLDGSPFAEPALPLALRLARCARATLDLVRVHVLNALKDPHAGRLPFAPSLNAEARELDIGTASCILNR